MAIQLFNSLTRRKEEFEPLEPGVVRMYHCGPTVYSSPHIGNFRAFLLADLLRRFFEDRGYRVHQVMNITDVGHMTADDEDRGEDKMVIAARREQLDPYAVARRYEDKFRDCLGKLGFETPHEMPRATEFIGQMGEIIDGLLERGFAYQVGGNVYFDISKFPEYGKLSKKVLDELVDGARVAVNEEKRDPRDFALWKTDEQHLMQWDAPFRGGHRGFPGWHIECSAMSMHFLGQTLDIHTGGEDNLFPHHECEVAQSESFTGRPFVRYWLHVKHLMVEGKKMSKSLGNFLTVRDVLDRGYTGEELRYALCRVQYRQSMNFTLSGLDEARAALGRVREARARLGRIAAGQEPAGGDDLGDASGRAEQEFVAALGDDLNTSEALAAVFGLVSAVNKAAPSVASAERALASFERFGRVLGVFQPAASAAVGGFLVGVADPAALDVPPDVRELVEQRQAARAAKDFPTADKCRDEIQARGYKLVDTPHGTRLERLEQP